MSLSINDIDGTKSGTKGMRAFKNYSRREFRETNKTGDISGAQVGTLLKAPVTNRATNPLNPQYQLLGAKELGENFNEYAENNSAHANKPTTAPVNTREQKNMFAKIDRQLSLDKETFRKDVGSFFGTAPGFMQEIDVKEIQKACKPPVAPKCLILKPKIESEKQFNRDTKKFYNLPLSEASEMSEAVNMFYRPETSKAINRKELNTNQEISRFNKVARPQSSSTANIKQKQEAIN